MSLHTNAKRDLLDAIETGRPPGDRRLFEAFDALESLDPNFLVGTWRGGVFHHDHKLGRNLQRINWYGKRFNGIDDVEPLLIRTDSGNIESWTGFGLARLREIRFRGKVSTAMLYDNQPLIDHFRRVSADVVIGLADEKGQPATYFFHLSRV
ncbi:DUF4334 domain-containing protein [Rhodococcus sp. NM-2]|uniref:DUF4334 domain-containing protein n=1 Tax=Rhodococcus sp. NM-2 TaxID=3401174 RepID=UPI003AAD0F84